MRICGRGLPTHQIRWKSKKTFCGRTDGRTDGRTHLSSNLLGHRRGDDLKINATKYFNTDGVAGTLKRQLLLMQKHVSSDV